MEFIEEVNDDFDIEYDISNTPDGVKGFIPKPLRWVVECALTLPHVQAAYANEVFKDSYCMGFLGVTEPVLELELERRLV